MCSGNLAGGTLCARGDLPPFTHAGHVPFKRWHDGWSRWEFTWRQPIGALEKSKAG